MDNLDLAAEQKQKLLVLTQQEGRHKNKIKTLSFHWKV